MQYTKLGNTNIEVSRMCFGGLIIGPLQVNLTPDEGAEVILHAFSKGCNFIDTAQLYGTYPHIKRALKRCNKDIVVATKSYAYTKEGARESLEEARRELDRDVIDIFLMHEQESSLTIKGHWEAYEYYMDAKAKGIIRAVGLSTHNVEVVEAAAQIPDIEIIHPLVNKSGIGIGDGSIEDMLRAVKKAYDNGKGIYSMKPLGGGNLISSYEESMKFALDLPFIHSVAIGMQSIEEVDMNIAVFQGKNVDIETKNKLTSKIRTLHIDYWCEGCGKCTKRCKQNALQIINGKAVVKKDKCTLCSYCAAACPLFAIKVN